MSNMQKWQPFVRKCTKNAHRRAEIGCLDSTVPGQRLEFWGAILNPLSLLLLDLALPVANKLGGLPLAVYTSVRAFYQEICFFARPKGALRLSARRAFGAP